MKGCEAPVPEFPAKQVTNSSCVPPLGMPPWVWIWAMVACSGWAGIGTFSGTVAEFTNTETELVVVPSEWTSLTTAELWNPDGHPTVVDQVGDVVVGLAVLPPGVRTSVPGDVP